MSRYIVGLVFFYNIYVVIFRFNLIICLIKIWLIIDRIYKISVYIIICVIKWLIYNLMVLKGILWNLLKK